MQDYRETDLCLSAQGRSEGETGIELTASGKHIIISKIRDGSESSRSFFMRTASFANIAIFSS